MKHEGCSYNGCDRPHRAKGLCVVHYYQQRRTGTLFEIRPQGGSPRRCSVDGCDAGHFARGWCKEHHRNLWVRFARYSLTYETFTELAERQGGTCAICGCVPPVFHVDHDHACCPRDTSCGRCVRGLLCSNCNQGIGRLGDSPERLRAALAYLDAPPARTEPA